MAHFGQHLQALDTILYQIRYRDPQRIRSEVVDILTKPHIASLTPQSRPLGMLLLFICLIYIYTFHVVLFTTLHDNCLIL
jgi:hypothetical protein